MKDNTVSNKEPTKTRRTRPPFESNIKTMPDSQPTITYAPYRYALSIEHSDIANLGNAYLEPLRCGIMDKLTIENKKIHISGTINQITDSEIKSDEFQSKEYINDLKFSFLRLVYGIYLKEYERTHEITLSIRLYVPDICAGLGMVTTHLSQEQINRLIQEINQFRDVIGVVKNGQYTDYYALLNFESYVETTNIITISSPYFESIIKIIFKDAIKRDKKGNARLKNGKPLTEPTHAYMICPTIAKEQCHAAVENVNIIVATIAAAGNKYTPHISAQTLYERNSLLQEQLKKCGPRRRNQTLARVFKKTLELLKSQTTLERDRPGIKLPNPKERNNIPTTKTLKTIVYNFL